MTWFQQGKERLITALENLGFPYAHEVITDLGQMTRVYWGLAICFFALLIVFVAVKWLRRKDPGPAFEQLHSWGAVSIAIPIALCYALEPTISVKLARAVMIAMGAYFMAYIAFWAVFRPSFRKVFEGDMLAAERLGRYSLACGIISAGVVHGALNSAWF